jgi:hypothetical protein
MRGRCHQNRQQRLVQRRPRHTGWNLGPYRQAKVSPPVPIRLLSRFPSNISRTVFRLPTELIVEMLTHFEDPHHNITSAKKARGVRRALNPDCVEQLTAIRVLTMTCWHLRNMLFPLLWKYVEGCNIFYRPISRRVAQDPVASAGNGLYAQCTYLIDNPTIAAYVRCVYSFIHRLKLTMCHSAGLSLWICASRTLRRI